jgi:hypothetical protein
MSHNVARHLCRFWPQGEIFSVFFVDSVVKSLWFRLVRVRHLEVKSLYKKQEYFTHKGHEGHKGKTFGFYSYYFEYFVPFVFKAFLVPACPG